MKLSELIAPHELHGSDVDISSLTSDSRAVRGGSLFAALPGTQVDGRDYIESALQNGAAAVLTLPGQAAMPVPYIASENPRRDYARHCRAFVRRAAANHGCHDGH